MAGHGSELFSSMVDVLYARETATCNFFMKKKEFVGGVYFFLPNSFIENVIIKLNF